MQNKANLLDEQMNVSSVITREYKNKSNWKLGENKANSNPIKPNLLDAKMNANPVLTKDYENVPLRRRGQNKPKQTQSPRPRFYSKNQLCRPIKCYNFQETLNLRLFLIDNSTTAHTLYRRAHFMSRIWRWHNAN
jgi:hypothetical protein